MNVGNSIIRYGVATWERWVLDKETHRKTVAAHGKATQAGQTSGEGLKWRSFRPFGTATTRAARATVSWKVTNLLLLFFSYLSSFLFLFSPSFFRLSLSLFSLVFFFLFPLSNLRCRRTALRAWSGDQRCRSPIVHPKCG
uniref:Transmembrane protein n=1 Tax=Anopheles merus TaxID=30066 RepID=A0A182V8M0_ANOME